jgi:dihydroxyacetone kinase-like predicted kinase
MQSITQSHLLQMLLKASSRVIDHAEQINAINIFPVPDSDTGSNLANTLLAIKKILDTHDNSSIEMIDRILDAALTASQGNSGVMMTSYLHGFLTPLKNKNEISFQDFSDAVKRGSIRARESVENPVDGTMLDVMDAFSLAFEIERKGNTVSFEQIFLKAIEQTKGALIGTEKKMQLLEEYHVVDAGALGFTHFVYGSYAGVSGNNIELSEIDIQPIKSAEKPIFGKFPFEVVFTVLNPLFSKDQLKHMFHSLGDSLDIVTIENRIKVHIHTDSPQVVKQTALLTGEVLTVDIVDMRNNAKE